MTFSSVSSSVAMVAVLMLGTAPATGYAFADDDARRAILDLREQVHQMNEQNRRIRLDFADQLEALKQEVMSLRGNIEQLQLTVNAQRRSDQGEGGSSRQVADPQEQAAYEGPLGLFRSGQYQQAVDGFDLFLQAYPDSTLAPEAQFYRGSGQYATKEFDKAIKGLRDLIAQSPKDTRAPDALLIIAASEIELDKLPEAKSTLERILKDYPDSSAAQTAKDRLKLL